MPPIDPVNKPKPKRVRVVQPAKPVKPAKVTVTVPDTGEATRTHSLADQQKVRMYAHPYRANPQKVMRQQLAEEQQQKTERKAVKKAVKKIHVTPVPSPDATDSLRSPAQQAHDAQVAAATVREQRVKAQREHNAGSGTRAVKAWVKQNIADELTAKKQAVTVKEPKGHGPGRVFGTILANTRVGGILGPTLANAAKDTAELAVTTPTSVAKLVSDVVHRPGKVPGELVKPYIDLAKRPIKTAEEKPVSTALMLQPVARVPGRAVGRVLRATGKQTLERPAATLPGTALREARTGSRDAAVRAYQARQDAKRPTPVVTAKQIQHRVDAHFDAAKHEAHRIEAEHVKAARTAAKGQPKDVRRAAVEQAREQARAAARLLADERFPREFGANERLSHGVAVREATHKVRRQAVARLDAAKTAAHAADAAHDIALGLARAARAKAQSSPKLAQLEVHRGIAVKALVDAQKAASTARAAHAKAIGRAQILTRNVTGRETPTRLSYASEDAPAAGMVRLYRGDSKFIREGQGGAREGRWFTPNIGKARLYGNDLTYVDVPREIADTSTVKNFLGASRGEHVLPDEWVAKARPVPEVTAVHYAGGGRGITVTQQEAAARAQAVHDVRAQIKDLDKQITAERQRISGVPPAQAQALTTAIHARGQARAVLVVARADAHAAAHAHITAKKAMTNSTLVSPASEGRLFAHKQDAATVVKKLNQTAHASANPITFVLHQVGEDRWAAVPKVARQRLYGSGGRGQMGHYNVGTSAATGAKLMRVSRGAFTNATLPFSAKWLAGQGAEAGIRAAVAGAGPMDWLRLGKVVKELNKKQAGLGDQLKLRVTGGHFDLTGPARDFANGKSLADEFAGTPLEKPANVASAVGRTAPARVVRHGWAQYTKAVFGVINHTIEQNARRAMAGQAIKDLGFQDTHILGLSDKAIRDAADGLRGTHNQVALVRAVNRMYGKYQGFSPEIRSTLLHWTPFLPWYLNTANFLFHVLPRHHPLKAALLADASAATEQWRKDHDLSLLGDSHVPGFLLGSYNGVRIAHYTPWGVGSDPTGAVGSLVLPQIAGPIANAAFGVDWKGQPLTRGGSHGPRFNTGEKAVRAAVTAAEEQVPLVSQAGAISGLTPRYVDKNDPNTIKKPGTVLKGYLPWTPVSGSAPASGSATPSGRVKLPGTGTGRIRIPGGAGGRIKIP